MVLRFRKLLVSLVVIGVPLFSFSTFYVYAQQTRTLTGEVRLDVGAAPRNLLIDVIVNNHSFVVVPPTFTIIRPITSTETQRITLREGEVSASYFIDDIITDEPAPVDYTVGLECIGCSDVFRAQYYSSLGNRFGFANQVYLDPAVLGGTLDVNIVSDVRISGEIKLGANAIAERNLDYRVIISDPANQDTVYLRSSNITLREGQASVGYQVTGLSRQIGSGQFAISALCTNCFANSAKPQILSTSQNHSNIDFLVVDQAPVVVTPILEVLLY